MAISLTKGGNINLSKESGGSTKFTVGLGWNSRATAGAAFDLDASAFLLTKDGKVRSDADFIFYKQTASTCGSVVHKGDNRTGDGDGDDEQLALDMAKVPADVEKIVFTVTIYEHDTRKQNFGMVSSAFIRVLDDGKNSEVARYDLSEDASTVTAMIFGELYRNGADWKFRAVGQGFDQGLAQMASNFGVAV